MRSFRLSAAMAIAAFATIIGAGAAMADAPIPPEHQTGSVGPYLIRDLELNPASTCVYPNTGGLVLKQIVVKAPEVSWPDTNSENDAEHGRIGHRIVVQKSTDGGATWTKVKASARQVKPATESAAADLTKRFVTLDLNGNNTQLRVYSKIQWIRPNGTIRGTLKHWYQYSRWTSDQFVENTQGGPCPNVLAS